MNIRFTFSDMGATGGGGDGGGTSWGFVDNIVDTGYMRPQLPFRAPPQNAPPHQLDVRFQ